MLLKLGDPLPSPTWSKIVWCRGIPFKVCSFIWKVVQDRLPVYTNLRARGIWPAEVQMCCKVCNSDADESMAHIFFHCTLAIQVWEKLCTWIDIQLPARALELADFVLLAHVFTNHFSVFGHLFWQGTIWLLWKNRNNCIFQDTKKSAQEILEQLKFNSWSWIKCKLGLQSNYVYADWEICPKGVVSNLCW